MQVDSLPGIIPVKPVHYGLPNHGRFWIYFIRAVGGPVKIGRTSDRLKKRLGQIQSSNPSKLKLLSAMQCECLDDEWLEFAIHAALAEHRVHGEWFNPVQRVLDYALLAKAGQIDLIRKNGKT